MTGVQTCALPIWLDLLAQYHRRTPDKDLRKRAGAMRVASLLRETLWARVAGVHRRVSVDFEAYGTEYLGRFEKAHSAFLAAYT